MNAHELFGADAASSAKHYLDGTHRITDPASTLSRVMPFAARMGITRVAVLTGLDVIGIPVVAAYRPNSRSIAVHQGKGTTLAAAKATRRWPRIASGPPFSSSR